MYDSTRHTPFIKAAEMGNMDHVRIFMMGNDFDIDLIIEIVERALILHANGDS